ncbi:hypothetical protein SKAU_G00134880 [Synaphobranchus kaupii]|uniref:Uncharacterized protein n=1 Tax=Synaphobranchus kaupii TaxID=118154 RepID=A0A9Q1FR90_SYNKA|nr:hypothetical protein SKAU_G00134880 [Synaphobranchus kaupii]
MQQLPGLSGTAAHVVVWVPEAVAHAPLQAANIWSQASHSPPHAVPRERLPVALGPLLLRPPKRSAGASADLFEAEEAEEEARG